jgi:hypothetical protein
MKTLGKLNSRLLGINSASVVLSNSNLPAIVNKNVVRKTTELSRANVRSPFVVTFAVAGNFSRTKSGPYLFTNSTLDGAFEMSSANSPPGKKKNGIKTLGASLNATVVEATKVKENRT